MVLTRPFGILLHFSQLLSCFRFGREYCRRCAVTTYCIPRQSSLKVLWKTNENVGSVPMNNDRSIFLTIKHVYSMPLPLRMSEKQGMSSKGRQRL